MSEPSQKWVDDHMIGMRAAYWLRVCEAHEGPVQLASEHLAALCRRLLELEAK